MNTRHWIYHSRVLVKMMVVCKSGLLYIDLIMRLVVIKLIMRHHDLY